MCMFVSYLRFIWNTFYLGFRIMVEGGSVIDYNGKLGYESCLTIPEYHCCR